MAVRAAYFDSGILAGPGWSMREHRFTIACSRCIIS